MEERNKPKNEKDKYDSKIEEKRKSQDPTTLKDDDSSDDDDDKEEEGTFQICLADTPTKEERSHTFRQRRLTYTKHNLAAAAAMLNDTEQLLNTMKGDDKKDENDNDDENDDGDAKDCKPSSSSDNKHKEQSSEEQQQQQTTTNETSNNNNNNNNETKSLKRKNEESISSSSSSPSQQPQQRHKRFKKSTTTSSSSSKKPILKRLESRTLHAGEIKKTSSCSPSSSSNTSYNNNNSTSSPESSSQRGWRRKRQHRNSITLKEEMKVLPFPRSIVGTFSCHGVEPLYDSDYEREEEEEEEEVVEVDKGSTTVAKINQDRGGVAFPYGNCPRTALFAAYDGHGEGGELVSQYSLHEIQRRLEKHPLFDTNVEQAFHDTFLAVDEELKDEPDIEPLYSGSTACVVLLRNQLLTIANVGDSRAVIARPKQKDGDTNKNDNDTNTTATNDDTNDDDDDNPFTSLDLSVDQNPDSPGEQERIIQNGGYVSPPPEEGLSARVWLDSSCTQIGLAMARSIGDHAVKPVGVIAEPVVTQHSLTTQDEFMILATDGVWEFISSEEAVNIVGKRLLKGEGSTKACQVLIEAAAAKWHEYEGDYRDDITALVIQLDKLWDSVNDEMYKFDDCPDHEDKGAKLAVV